MSMHAEVAEAHDLISAQLEEQFHRFLSLLANVGY
jgi:hypothetical protein